MAYTKKELYKITRKLYKELRENSDLVILKKIRGAVGIYDPNTENVILDYRGDFISTMIHEYLHKWNPEKCETWVLNEESKIINSLSHRQIKNLIKAFAKHVCN